eukprot:TRINITY_DN28113_c0_g1_i2.p1 TRINITY_DN28113_c0_g1~~TRINITY_DN28113_c0_g1_i2.p1  ORF type:complete len:312 (-),score=62.02 TRINITY_DN28113_c0_g1_i2:206-1141(-)
MATDADLRVRLLDGDMELPELEGLTAPRPKPWPHSSSSEELVDALFASLAATAEQERERIARLHLRDSAAKRSRREQYLDARRLAAWKTRSRDFLARRREIANSLTTTALYSSLALQHLVDVDAEGLRLPPERRCTQDTFTDGVNDQFLLDAPRNRFTVNGESYTASARADISREDFVARLTAAVRSAVPAELLALTTTVMSQSGMAALERASLCSAAVSGGRQEVDLGLRTDAAQDRVVITLQLVRRGFQEYELACNGDQEERRGGRPRFCRGGRCEVRRPPGCRGVPGLKGRSGCSGSFKGCSRVRGSS